MPLTLNYSNGFFIAFGLYWLATFLYCLRIIFNNKNLAVIGFRAALAAFFIQVGYLCYHFYQIGYPFFITSFETMQVLSGLIILLFFILSFFYRYIATGIIFIPLTLLFYIRSLSPVVSYQYPGHLLENSWAFVHLVFIFMAMAVFVISFTTGIFYLILDYRLKHKKFGGFLDRFPPLEILDLIHYRALYVGFVFFTLGIITGGGWSKSVHGVYITNQPKQMISFAVWAFFALFLNLRISRGLIGRRGILFSTIGFVGILFLLTWVQR